ncbi:heat shock protein 23-like [Chironomus tepperi]|uniref:heat shock protein 23-like n=1 Tax=Chironomus tepperi TaxID=113505 RepID=UPI00391EF0CD
MSLLPLIFEDYYNYPRRYHQYRHHPFNDFAFGLNPNELTAILALPTEMRPLENRARCPKKCGESKMIPTTGKDGFQVCVDVQQFNPNEISVKTVDNFVVIEGNHEERQDEHGFISRKFTRRYALPKGYDPNTVTSSLSSDGVLTVKAPKPQSLESNERVIPITHTGPAHLSVKENKEANGEEEKKEEK